MDRLLLAQLITIQDHLRNTGLPFRTTDANTIRVVAQLSRWGMVEARFPEDFLDRNREEGADVVIVLRLKPLGLDALDGKKKPPERNE